LTRPLILQNDIQYFIEPGQFVHIIRAGEMHRREEPVAAVDAKSKSVDMHDVVLPSREPLFSLTSVPTWSIRERAALRRKRG
jgi:hypothetical protein